MQRGLNIGIGSWIDAQQGTGTLPALPVNPIPFKLSHLSNLETPEDLARATELSLFCNREVQPGGTYVQDGIPRYLWEIHGQIIGNMVTAVAPLTPAQQRQLERANSILYNEDGFSISSEYMLFQETRQVYQEVVSQDAPPEEVRAAYEAWVIVGNKALIEEAIATKLSVTRTTSRLVAQGDLDKINLALMSFGGDVPNPPTLFTPISAVSTEHWTEAEVEFQALEDAIKPEVPRTSWREFRANKIGTVRFKFTAVDLVRSWFTAGIYEADDWRLADGGNVASGNGREGSLPSYFSRIYLAQVLEVRSRPASSPRPGQQKSNARPTLASSKFAVSAARPMKASGGVAGGPAQRSLQAHGRIPNPSRTPETQGQSRGIVRIGNTAAKRPPALVALQANRPPSFGISQLATKPHLAIGSVGRIARIQKLSPVIAMNRVNFVQAFLAAPAASPLPKPNEPTTHIVGFGRTNLPNCPNPNPNYQWP